MEPKLKKLDEKLGLWIGLSIVVAVCLYLVGYTLLSCAFFINAGIMKGTRSIIEAMNILFNKEEEVDINEVSEL